MLFVINNKGRSETMNLPEELLEIHDIHQLAERLSSHLQKAIIIENRNFELIAYSAPPGFSFDPVQQKTILTKRCPLYVIEWLKKEGVVKRLEENNHPIRLHRMEDIDFYERVVISLKYDGRLFGYLWIYEAALLTDEHLAFLTEIAPHLGESLFQKQHVEENSQQEFIWRLLNHEYTSETEMLEEAKRFALYFPKKYTVLVYSVRNAEYVYVLDKIKAFFNRKGVIYYLGKGTEIIGLIASDSPNNYAEELHLFMEQVAAILSETEKKSVFAGAGNAYETLPALRKSYTEALEVIETFVFLNVSEQTVIHFQELGIYRHMKSMYQKNMDDSYYNDAILRIMQADQANNSELLISLWYFLVNDCKINKTAEALFIHPNTLSYRMKQIENLVVIHFGDIEEKMELYIQLMLIQFVPDYRAFYENAADKYPAF